MGAAVEYFRRQRDVCGDDEIAGRGAFDDFVVGHVEARAHPQRLDESRARHGQRLIGDQRRLCPGALGGPKQDFLDHDRAGVRVNPNLHGVFIWCLTPRL